MDESYIKVRVSGKLKNAFKKACAANDQNASQTIRQFMRQYVTENQKRIQPRLFQSGYKPSREGSKT
ncbi:hypothetical protein [Rhodocaloribacter sp.]